jgi:lysophospholipase L1-like esterase
MHLMKRLETCGIMLMLATGCSGGDGAPADAGSGGSGAVAGSTSAGTGTGGTGGTASSAVTTGGGGDGGFGGSGGVGGQGGSPELPNTTVFIAGDSTVMTYKADDPLKGWGQMIGQYFNDKVAIKNYALGGRSTRTFMYKVTCVNGQPQINMVDGKPDSSGTRWEKIVNEIKAGDYLLIQFGHNDASNVCERHVEPEEYKGYLGVMADFAKSKNATPIFVTPMSQLSYKDGAFKNTLLKYAGAMKEEGVMANVQVADLNARSVAFYQEKGYDFVSQNIFNAGEVTHFQAQGAVEMARMVSEELVNIGSPLGPYVK